MNSHQNPQKPLGHPPSLAGLEGFPWASQRAWGDRGRNGNTSPTLRVQLLRTCLFQLPHPEGQFPTISWMNPYKAKTEHLLCVDILFWGFYYIYSLKKDFFFSWKMSWGTRNADFNQPAVFLIWCPLTALSFHVVRNVWSHLEGKKTYCQSLLILCNYIKTLEITLALMTGLFASLFSF